MNALDKPSRTGIEQVNTGESKKKGLLTVAVVLSVSVVAPEFFDVSFLMKVMCFAVAASSVNLLLGYVGLLSFGHAMFFGLASYICAHFVKVIGLPFEESILAGTASSLVLAIAVGAIAIRRQGIYLSMTTMAIGQMIYFICLQANFTGGEDGIQDVPRAMALGILDIRDEKQAYYYIAVICILALFSVYRLINSPIGQILRAIRDNEPRAISLGYNVYRYKLFVFAVSGALAGLAGATKVVAMQLASLTDVSWHMSGELLLMALIGGLGTFAGPIVGAAFVVAIQTYLAELGDWVLLIEGFAFFVVVLLFRQGLVGEINIILKKYLNRT